MIFAGYFMNFSFEIWKLFGFFGFFSDFIGIYDLLSIDFADSDNLFRLWDTFFD